MGSRGAAPSGQPERRRLWRLQGVALPGTLADPFVEPNFSNVCGQGMGGSRASATIGDLPSALLGRIISLVGSAVEIG